MKYLNKILLVFTFTLASCASAQHNLKQPPTVRVPIETATATPIVIPAKTGTAIPVYDYISRPEHKKDCPGTNPSTILSQISYRDVYPGITSANDARDVLGEPTDIIEDGAETNWLYDNYPVDIVSVIIINNIVDRIGIDTYDISNSSLREIVEEYGCPSLIYITDRSEHSAGNYDVATFSYPDIGVEFWFDGIKLTQSSVPSEIRYFEPISVVDYVQLYKEILYIDSPMSEPVYWHEVVVDK
jgi:hypothetical protein